MSTRHTQKKWSSFVEMRDDLLKEGIIKLEERSSVKDGSEGSDNFFVSNILQIVKDTETGSTPRDLFNCLCRLSALVENLEEHTLIRLLNTTNLYVLLLSAVFTNKNFSEKLFFVVKKEKEIHEKDIDGLNIDVKKFLNAGISLAFFPIALMLPALSRESIIFLRQHITKLIKLNLKDANDYDISFANLCFKVESISRNHQYHYIDKFPVSLNREFLFNTLRIARSISGISLLSLTIITVLGEQFKKSIILMDSDKRFNLSGALNNIHGAVFRIEAGVQSYYNDILSEKHIYLQNFFNTFVWNNEKDLTFFVKEVTAGFQYQSGKTFQEVILAKVAVAGDSKSRLSTFAKQNLSAFTGTLVGEEREWANKIFIVSIKSITALAEINSARDNDWKSSVAVRELTKWIREVHEILNLFYLPLEDEFNLITQFLKEENVKIEWKSTFLTPTEEVFINDKAELAKGKEVFLGIVKAVLGMLNTDGGVIVVGFIEHPDRIVRDDLLKHIVIKNGKSFFNIGYELSQKNKNLDQIRLQILDNLKSLTQLSEEKFNNLFYLEPILLRSSDKTITVIKISVQKVVTPIFNVREDQGTTWISLTKRADGKTINVDVRDYI